MQTHTHGTNAPHDTHAQPTTPTTQHAHAHAHAHARHAHALCRYDLDLVHARNHAYLVGHTVAVSEGVRRLLHGGGDARARG
jgi:hypothetical protein